MNVIRRFSSYLDGLSDRLCAIPVDIVFLCAYLLLVSQSVDLLAPGSTLRFVLTVPLLLFVPGYALTIVLFPATAEHHRSNVRWLPDLPGLDGVERAALSFGLSVVLLPVFALSASLLFGTVRVPIVLLVSVAVLVLLLAGWWRRSRLSADHRFTITAADVGRTIQGGTTGTRMDTGINIFLGVCVVAAVGVFAFGLAAPQQGATYAEFSLGTESDGTFVTSGYQTEFQSGESAQYSVLVENNENRAVTYTVVVQLERVDDGVVELDELDRLSVETSPGETVIRDHQVTPTLTGDDLRLTYLLYTGDPPENPGRESADESLHLWIDVGT